MSAHVIIYLSREADMTYGHSWTRAFPIYAICCSYYGWHACNTPGHCQWTRGENNHRKSGEHDTNRSVFRSNQARGASLSLSGPLMMMIVTCFVFIHEPQVFPAVMFCLKKNKTKQIIVCCSCQTNNDCCTIFLIPRLYFTHPSR